MIDYVLFEKYARGLSVLLVDDDNFIKEETSELLTEIFKFVDVASDGSEAINRYKDFYNKNNRYFDIVISDVHMPNVNGVELTKMIYSLNPEQKLIIISAYSQSTNLIDFINLGVSQFITKPIDINLFIDILYNVSEQIYKGNKILSNQNRSEIYLTNNIFWNKDNKKLVKSESVIKLTKREALLIDLLLQVKDKTYSTDEIISYLWEDDLTADALNLKNVVSRLRKKIPEINIENVYGLGYKISF